MSQRKNRKRVQRSQGILQEKKDGKVLKSNKKLTSSAVEQVTHQLDDSNYSLTLFTSCWLSRP